MKRLSTGLVAVAAMLALVPAAGAGPAPAEVPASIAVPDGHKLYLVAHAEGVQIYSCNGSSWSLVAPRANLYGDNRKLIGTHFAGPSWQASDGSKVVGRRAGDPVTVDSSAIPWLLVEATSATAGPEGDRLARTTFIQRIATTGGLAPPASECDTAGDHVEIPYTADYLFWKARS